MDLKNEKISGGVGGGTRGGKKGLLEREDLERGSKDLYKKARGRRKGNAILSHKGVSKKKGCSIKGRKKGGLQKKKGP